jgi:hypothetical protein
VSSGKSTVTVDCAEKNASYRREFQRESGSRLQTATRGEENPIGKVSNSLNPSLMVAEPYFIPFSVNRLNCFHILLVFSSCSRLMYTW